MSFEQYINFRATGGFVTDAAKTHAQTVIAANYPVTPSAGDSTGVGYTGVGASMESRDRNAAYDPRIAGLHKIAAGSSATYRINLPAPGVYEVSVAIGDANGGVVSECELFDNASSLGVLTSGTTSAAARWKDATNTELTNTTWPTSAVWVSKTFASSVAIFKMGNGGATPNWSHVGIRQLAVTPTITSTSTATPAEGASVTLTGTNFGATQGASTITFGGTAVTPSAWSDTSITFPALLGLNKYLTSMPVIVTVGGVPSATYTGITGITVPALTAITNVATPYFDASMRLAAVPDAVSGDQVQFDNPGYPSGTVNVNDDLTWDVASVTQRFRARLWTAGEGYGPWATQIVFALSNGTRSLFKSLRGLHRS